MQELNREANTLGSKSVVSEVSQTVNGAQAADRANARAGPEPGVSRGVRSSLHRLQPLRGGQNHAGPSAAGAGPGPPVGVLHHAVRAPARWMAANINFTDVDSQFRGWSGVSSSNGPRVTEISMAPRVWIESEMAAGRDILLEIDWQGAQQVRGVFPQAIGVFIPAIAR